MREQLIDEAIISIVLRTYLPQSRRGVAQPLQLMNFENIGEHSTTTTAAAVVLMMVMMMNYVRMTLSTHAFQVDNQKW